MFESLQIQNIETTIEFNFDKLYHTDLNQWVLDAINDTLTTAEMTLLLTEEEASGVLWEKVLNNPVHGLFHDKGFALAKLNEVRKYVRL